MVFIRSHFHHPGVGISPAQNAILHVQLRIMPPTFNNKEGPAIPRLIVSPKQVGCILGKAGSIIAKMGNLSKAHIIVLRKDKLPRGVQQSDEIVQGSMNLHLLGFILMRLCFIQISWDDHWMRTAKV